MADAPTTFTVEVNVPAYAELPLDRFRDLPGDSLGDALDDYLAAEFGNDYTLTIDRQLVLVRLRRALERFEATGG